MPLTRGNSKISEYPSARAEFFAERFRVAIKTEVTSNAVGREETEREQDKDGVHTHGSGEHKVECHKEGEECGGAGAEPDDEPESNGELTKHDGVRPRDEVGEHGALEERGIPHLDVRMGTNGLGERPLDIPRERAARARAEPRRIDKLLPPSHKELVAEVEADDEPERRRRLVCGKEVSERGLRNGVGIHTHILKHPARNGNAVCGLRLILSHV